MKLSESIEYLVADAGVPMSDALNRALERLEAMEDQEPVAEVRVDVGSGNMPDFYWCSDKLRDEQKLYALPPVGSGLTQAARDVLAERQRQIEVEGWTPEHDDQHSAGALGRAGGTYASNAGAALYFGTTDTTICDNAPYGWPFEHEWWKPDNARRDLVKAAALILAEIERMDRAKGKEPVTLGEQVADARREIASWSDEKRKTVQIEGQDYRKEEE